MMNDVLSILLAVSIPALLTAVLLAHLLEQRRRRQETDALRETLAEMAREQNISEAEAAMRKMRGQ